jgi:hypothetical protein
MAKPALTPSMFRILKRGSSNLTVDAAEERRESGTPLRHRSTPYERRQVRRGLELTVETGYTLGPRCEKTVR